MTEHILTLLREETPRLHVESRRFRFSPERKCPADRIFESEEIPEDFQGSGAKGGRKDSVYLQGVIAGFLFKLAAEITEEDLSAGVFDFVLSPVEGTGRFRFTLGGRIKALEAEVERLRACIKQQQP